MYLPIIKIVKKISLLKLYVNHVICHIELLCTLKDD